MKPIVPLQSAKYQLSSVLPYIANDVPSSSVLIKLSFDTTGARRKLTSVVVTALPLCSLNDLSGLSGCVVTIFPSINAKWSLYLTRDKPLLVFRILAAFSPIVTVPTGSSVGVGVGSAVGAVVTYSVCVGSETIALALPGFFIVQPVVDKAIVPANKILNNLFVLTFFIQNPLFSGCKI